MGISESTRSPPMGEGHRPSDGLGQAHLGKAWDGRTDDVADSEVTGSCASIGLARLGADRSTRT